MRPVIIFEEISLVIGDKKGKIDYNEKIQKIKKKISKEEKVKKN